MWTCAAHNILLGHTISTIPPDEQSTDFFNKPYKPGAYIVSVMYSYRKG